MSIENPTRSPEFITQTQEHREACLRAIYELSRAGDIANREGIGTNVYLARGLVGVLRWIEQEAGLDPLEDDLLRTTTEIIKDTNRDLRAIKEEAEVEGLELESAKVIGRRVRVIEGLPRRLGSAYNWHETFKGLSILMTSIRCLKNSEKDWEGPEKGLRKRLQKTENIIQRYPYSR